MSEQTASAPAPGRASGFELKPDDPSGAGGIEEALRRNRAFAAAGGHEGAVVFPQLRLFVVTCLDPRTDPAHLLGLELSEAMVIRNGGGRVTPTVIEEVAFIAQIVEGAIPDGPLFEVAIIHHNQCGTAALADDGFRRRYAERVGAEESELRDHAVVDPAATVRADVELLRAAPAVPDRVRVSGHVYDVTTGLVETVEPA
ncbi:MAG TPA: carbonic anhydrase [Solirubrobacterales bacterium]|jgi:carbonic anhydrase